MDNYYSVPALSASGINAFQKSPLHYWNESPFNPAKKISIETPAMVFGRICHKLALEYDSFDQEYTVLPSIDRRTKEGKIAHEAFILNSEGKTVVTQESYQEAITLARAMQKNSAVQQLLQKGEAELPLFWQNGIDCKAKLDYYRKGLILDYKTSIAADKKSFEKSLLNFGYHRQAAWYLDGVERCYGERPKGFIFIVQDKNLPEAIGVYAIEQSAIDIGRTENTTALAEITTRLDNNSWEAFPKEIQPIGLPAWYN